MVFSHGSSPPRTRWTRPSQNSLPFSPMIMPVLPGMSSPGGTLTAAVAAAAGVGVAPSTSIGAGAAGSPAPSAGDPSGFAAAGGCNGCNGCGAMICTAPGASTSTVPSSNSMTILAPFDHGLFADLSYRSQSMM